MLYIVPPLATEPTDLADEAFEFIESRIPGWLPSEGHLETWLIEAMSQQGAEIAAVAAAVPPAVFAYYGATILGLPPYEAMSATAQTLWTVVDALGYTIPQGTLIGIPASGSDLVPFETIDDIIIPAGSTTATIVCAAVDAGTDANQLTDKPQLIDALRYVSDIALSAPTTGGVDAENDDEYLDRLRELTTLLAPRPILPNDFALLAKSDARVYRATAIDLHQAGVPEDPKTGSGTPIPAASADGVARCVTVAVVGDDGLSIGAQARQEVATALDAQREVNFYVYVVDPTYTTVNIVFSIRPYTGYVASDVVARVVAALTNYLSPAVYGAPPFGDQSTWVNDLKVRYLEIAQQVNDVEGVNYIISLTVNGGTADVALTGTAPLVKPGAITGTAA